jgi:hypothetical protein
VVADNQAPDIALHIMLFFGQLTMKYFHPPHNLLLLLSGLAQFCLRVERTPCVSPLLAGLRQ